MEMKNPRRCYTVINAEVQEGIALQGTEGNKVIAMGRITIPVEEPAPERLIWANVESANGVLKIVPCQPPKEADEDAGSTYCETLTHIVMSAKSRPLFFYTGNLDNILRQAKLQHRNDDVVLSEELHLLALISPHDLTHVYNPNPGRFESILPNRGGPASSYSLAWRMVGGNWAIECDKFEVPPFRSPRK